MTHSSAGYVTKFALVRMSVWVATCWWAALPAQRPEPDRDRDGLSDFHEVHKHLTDPTKADSDGDGVDDGDWLERREYQYTVRTVVQVMKPVTVGFLTDDYQDARVLDETDSYVELEVIHYPFNTVDQDAAVDVNWRKTAKNLAAWVAPGATSDWTPPFRSRIKADLKAADIDVARLNDRALVEQASAWLMERAEHQQGFSSFVTAFDEDGKPFVPDGLKGDRTDEEFARQWERELSATGMYEHRAHGSCTSSAIYLSGCLKALGVPTRTVLCIPVVDANDERELAMVESQIQHPEVRAHLLAALDKLRGSWASHTFNEVYVGGRWRRLNYDRLGQGIYDRQLFGLITHVATFRDWADARFWETVGRRQKGRDQTQNDIFGGPNPYSAIALRDLFGPHCALECPDGVVETATVRQVYWTDSEELPESILDNLRNSGRSGLIALVDGLGGFEQFTSFLKAADNRAVLKAGELSLPIRFDPGCVWYRNGRAHVYLPLEPDARRQIESGQRVLLEASNQTEGYRWEVADGVGLTSH